MSSCVLLMEELLINVINQKYFTPLKQLVVHFHTVCISSVMMNIQSSRHGLVIGSFERGNEPSASIKCRKYLC